MTGSLVLLTDAFPYGRSTEPFLETEIEFLAARFPKIYVLPSHRAPTVRPLPAGVELIEMPWLTPARKARRAAALLSPEAAATWRRTLTSRATARRYLRSWRVFCDNLAHNILKARGLATLISERTLQDAVFYDYWYENSTLALSLLKTSGKIRTAVARAHNFDVYDENWETGEVPFQRAKSIGMDAIFVVSESGAAYLRQRLPHAHTKIRLERLGVWDPGTLSPQGDEVPLVLTCAFLRPEKRIHLVPEVLARLGRPVRWLHFGDGPEYERVLAAASRLPSRVSWKLAGLVPNTEVRAFYAAHDVASLLSLSVSEGLPVSMMEAVSHGVPLVACNAGGVSEIVTGQTGLLLDRGASVDAISAALSSVLDAGLSRSSIHDFFKERFDAETNYTRFADALSNLG
jgi:glycosyltransferase involved in cell wall biosynthesis